jgi:DNA-binding MarR family transcriptional regulator
MVLDGRVKFAQWNRADGDAHDPFAHHLVPVTKNQKYVNMADISITAPIDPVATGESRQRAAMPFDLIELLFFAYRDFVGDADAVLAEFGFGRAHHRVLHFINRNPGMKVAELLDILKITKQSLGRVLKQLLDEGYVEQREGASDRRQRLLYVTAKGDGLASRLAGLQAARIGRALAVIGVAERDTVRRFLIAMLDADERDGVLRLIEGASGARRRHRG